MLIKILQAGSITKEVEVSEGETFHDALVMAELEVGDSQLRFNGRNVSLEDPITESGRVILAKGAKGNA